VGTLYGRRRERILTFKYEKASDRGATFGTKTRGQVERNQRRESHRSVTGSERSISVHHRKGVQFEKVPIPSRMGGLGSHRG